MNAAAALPEHFAQYRDRHRGASIVVCGCGESLTFSGTVAANKTLVIDTGTMQVKNDGVDAYDDLAFTPTADLATWFSLLPGSNALTITYTGATGGDIEFAYYEAWY